MARKWTLLFHRRQTVLNQGNRQGRRKFLLQHPLFLLLICTATVLLTIAPSLATLPPSNGLLPHPAPTTAQSPTLLQQGKALYDTGRYLEAIQVLQQAVQDSRDKQDTLSQAIALSNLSLAYQQVAAWAEAQQAITESLRLLNASQSSTSNLQTQQVLAQSLDIQGRLQLLTGQPEQALTTWQQATTRYKQAGDRAGEIRSRINQAQALQASGLYRRALEVLTDLNQALQPDPDSLPKAVGLRSLGDALQLVGDLDQSSKVLQQSLAIAQRLQSAPDIASALLSLGNTARAQSQLQPALAYYQEAAQRSPTPILQTQAQLNRFTLLLETNQLPAAQTLLPQILSTLNTLPPSRATVYARINLAQSLMRLGNRGQETGTLTPHSQTLAPLLATAIQHARSLGDRRAESYALGTLGGLYEQTRQWPEAQQLTEQALLLAQALNAPDVAYRWQWQLGRLLKQQGNTSQAIAAYDAAVNALQSLRSDLVAVNREVQFNFRDSVEPVYRQMVELLLQSQADTPSEQTLDKARRLIESLQLAELDNFFREACLNAQSVLLDKIVDRDNPTAAIVYPIILDHQLAVILKIPQQPLQYYTTPLPRAEAEQVLTRLRQIITEPDRIRETRSLLLQIYGWLIQPVDAELQRRGVNTLVFVPDGELRNLPMAALYDGKQYLLEKYATALSPGLQLFSPRPLAQVQVNALTAGLSEPPQLYSQFSPLPEVKSELDLIEQAGIKTTRLLDQAFTSKTLEQTIRSLPFTVVHLATHGQFSSEASNTFILAADGPINVNQLDSLLRTRNEAQASAVELLVLSACQTAAGDNRAALGLAGVAIRAGARSTLASLWNVGDRSTAEFIGEFYRQFVDSKVTKAEALRRAQLALLNNPAYSRPASWAAYVLVGNWL